MRPSQLDQKCVLSVSYIDRYAAQGHACFTQWPAIDLL